MRSKSNSVTGGLRGLMVLGFLVMTTGSAASQSSNEASETTTEHSAPTFYGDVQPILNQNCVSCHQSAKQDDIDQGASGFYSAGLTAPMSLETYEVAKDWAPMIARVVESRRMPPWSASPEFKGVFKDERYLEEEEMATLKQWVMAGAPEGDPADAQPYEQEMVEETANPSEWSIGEPDLVVQIPEPVYLADDVVDEYINMHIKLTEEQHPEGRWVKRAEIKPGSNYVHHINVRHMATIAPGRQSAMVLPEGYGFFLPDTATIYFDMHYNKTTGPGTGGWDQSGGAVVFYDEGEVVNYAVETFSGFDGSGSPEPSSSSDLLVPAGAKNYAHTATQLFEEDTYLLSTAPHMHMRGKAARLEIEYPDGQMETLLDIPNYDFMWQHKYDFKEPVFMPAGSVLHLTGWWDNTEDNRWNPDPTIDVPFGLPSQMEMLTGRVFVARAEPLNHTVGKDAIPQYVLEDAQRYREEVAQREHGVITSLTTADGPVDLPDRENAGGP